MSSHRLSSARLNSFKKPRETLIAQAFSSGGGGGGGGVGVRRGEAWEPGNAGEKGVESVRKAGKKRESIA